MEAATATSTTTTTINDGDQFQLVPHYGPQYNQYALPEQWTNTDTYNPSQPPTSEPSLNQPPPVHPDVAFEFLPGQVQQTYSPSYAVVPDLLSDDPIPLQQQQQQQQQHVPPTEVYTTTPPPEQTTMLVSTDDIPPEVMASQMRALAQIQQQQQERSLTTTCASSQALVTVPASANPIGSDAIHPQKFQMKARRQRRQVGGAVGGVIVGGLTLGPAGALLGGVVGGVAANKVHKIGERRAQRKWEQNNYQKGIEEKQQQQLSMGAAFA
jgi:hypothetical protein